MSTPDQLLYSALHGTAMRYAAGRRNLDESIEELRQIADSRNDLLAEAAGITAGPGMPAPPLTAPRHGEQSMQGALPIDAREPQETCPGSRASNVDTRQSPRL
jgi:hypothetical protein